MNKRYLPRQLFIFIILILFFLITPALVLADVSPTVPAAEIPGKPSGYAGALPDCVWTEGQPNGGCRDVDKLLELIIKFASGFFALLGTFAFAYFVYGGFIMIMSFGNAEKVKKGRDTLVQAAVGLLICFVAYAAVKFMLDVLQVAPAFRAIN